MSTRRGFIKTTVIGGATVMGVGTGAVGCGNDVSPAPYTPASVIDDASSPHYGSVSIDPTRYPDLAPVGGALTLNLPALPPDPKRAFVAPPAILLVHRGAPGDEPEYVATQSICPHKGCSLGYSASDKLIECPCHGSQFLAIADPNKLGSCTGQVVHLPANRSLNTYKVTVDAGMLYIDVTPTSCMTLQPTTTPSPMVVNGQVILPVSDYPNLAASGGTVTVNPMGLQDVLIVVRVDTSSVTVLSALCTHQQCTVSFDAAKKEFPCPCHGSVFAIDGSVVNGPAARPLKSYSATVDETAVTITVS